ncbi:hypothetical protein FB45DRAFT_946701 [Roridomyces roridus]|uniref:F-box domain-containing protein n=1 Tax=Roridomyces roridus TaxID=1738132 RepID=A0AAD7B394_9AGAR|nr:hypothetical protein FB45DRAFT_946701 [Roridomyces roridus]
MAASPPPILRLPDELLIEIAAANPQNSLTPDHPSEWVLSHVCRRFRRAVTSVATLWTRVALDLCCDASAEVFRLYLERSSACTIEVILHAMHDAELESPKGLHYLRPHITRIARLTIVVDCADSHEALDTILTSFRNVVMPSLEYLEIKNSSDREIDILDLSPLETPNITSLKMTYCTPSFPPPPWMVPIAHLHLSGNTYPAGGNSDIFRFIITQHPSLVYLYLDVSALTFGLGNGIVSRSLTHLDLEFDESDTDGLSRELASFDTPNLTHLSLHFAHGDQLAFLFDSIKPASRLAFPAVTSLTLANADRTQCHCEVDQLFRDEYKSITAPPLRLFPVMSSLTLIRECFTPRIVSDLLGPGSQPWPQLEILALKPMAADEQNLYATLRDVVRWKQSQQEPLPTFKLSPDLFARDFWAENGVVVELLEEHGMVDSVF